MKTLLGSIILIATLAACGGGRGGSSPIPSVGSTTGSTSSPAGVLPAPQPTGAHTPNITPTPVPTPIQSSASYVAVGDSITYGDYTTSVQTQSYAAVLAADLSANLTNLGIPGETSTNVLPDEISAIPSSAQVITIFIGTNDELQFAEYNQSPVNIYDTFASNMALIANRMYGYYWSNARIYVANLPNLANFPQWKNASASQRAAISQLNQQINKVIDGMGFPVVDLRCDPRSYDASNLQAGTVYPNTQGHAYYADDFYATIQGSLKESQTCSFVNLV